MAASAMTRRMIALAAVLGQAGVAAPAEGPSLIQADRWPNAVVAVGLFLVLLLVLRRLAWKPLLRVIQDREESVRAALSAAEQRRAESDKLLAEYRAQLAGAQQDIMRMMAESTRVAEEARLRIVEEARQAATTTTEQARQEIERAKRHTLEEIYRTTTDLATTMAGKILAREIQVSDHQRLLAESIEAIGKEA